MAQKIELYPSSCAICGTENNAEEIYPANYDLKAFNPTVFSARRLPDRVHYRMVKCNNCGLVRADPVADSQKITQLYAQSSFDYTDELADLKRTYGHYLSKLNKYGVKKLSLLEIGCGNGFFLEEALSQGYVSVHGVEPSVEAVSRANNKIKANIICDTMRHGLFKPGQFDVICMFQLFDHISNVGEFLDQCFYALKPGGLVLCLNHNIESFSSRIFGERSPIIDIEHVFLYSPATITTIFKKHGFIISDVGTTLNINRLYYLARLIPFSSKIKSHVLKFLQNSMIGSTRLWLPLGNLYLIAQKPKETV